MFWPKRKSYRAVSLAGMKFPKKLKKQEKLKLSDPPERIVVEMVGGSDRPKGPPGLKGLQAQRASRLEGPPGPIYKGKQGKGEQGKQE